MTTAISRGLVPKATMSGEQLQSLGDSLMRMKNTTVKTMTKIEIPDTPIKAKNLSFYILLTIVKGDYKTATTIAMNN